jgi:protein-disulfide isomerase
MEPTNTKSSLAIPLSIIFGFGLIAVAIYFSGIGSQGAPTAQQNNQPVAAQKNIRPVDSTDYIKGNPNAPILIVEYSDYDCPFCKQFHDTMNRIIDEYGVNGQVAWVYRQFPIVQLHPNAPGLSEAALCVGEVAGNDAFWKFSDLIFGERAINEPTNVTRVPEFAVTAGADEAAFKACMESGRMKEVVTASYNEAVGAGDSGYTTVICHCW